MSISKTVRGLGETKNWEAPEKTKESGENMVGLGVGARGREVKSNLLLLTPSGPPALGSVVLLGTG